MCIITIFYDDLTKNKRIYFQAINLRFDFWIKSKLLQNKATSIYNKEKLPHFPFIPKALIPYNKFLTSHDITANKSWIIKKIYQRHIKDNNTLKLFWPILGQRETSLVIVLWKRRTSSVIMAWYRPLEIILWPKRQLNSFFLFHKNITKHVFL